MPEEEIDDEELEDAENLDDVVDDIQELELGSDEDESLNMDDYSDEDIDGEKEAVKMSRQVYHKIEVDTWLTKLHTATIGIRQKDQYRAQSRQFSAGTEVEGEVSFFSYPPEELSKPHKERKGLKKVKEYKEIVAIANNFWDYTDKESLVYKLAQKFTEDYDPTKFAKLSQRLVMKTFTELKRDKKKEGHAGRWRGTIEESRIMSINAMFGERRGIPRPFFYVNIPGYKYRLCLWRTHTFFGERYAFTVPNPETGELTTFYIKELFLAPGRDYKVYNAETGEKVAKIDDRALNVGGKVTIKLVNKPATDNLNRSEVFRRMLILFSLTLRYMDSINKKYKNLFKALKAKGKYMKKIQQAKAKNDTEKYDAVNAQLVEKMKKCKVVKSAVVTNSELTLHYNPRRMRT